ncbi:oligosaccharide flippase family protein [Morganella morganii]|uniref:oligosaccharide flippase family protein n=1 Tax=Morganella morganii TaxID=582 RepID=UPI00228CEC35|nr:oligosaccharide flippase family protein [Morganella morganii]HEM7567090.1 oligosaccharide flippase family protein [Serratia marcescens]
MLKKNILANYISQIYIAVIGIILLPLYIKYMGSEAYGLIGFFSILQAWFNVLDLGLTPTISRETARYRSGVISTSDFQQLLKILTIVFVIIAGLGGISLFLLSEKIAINWLKAVNIPINEVIFSVQVMSVSVALRWMGGLYRGIISGSEKLVILSGLNSLIATLRFVAVFIVMWKFGFTPYVFFMYQFIVAIIEVLLLFYFSYKLTPTLRIRGKLTLKPIKPLLAFSLTIAFTSSIWILITQTDKFILSGILSLENYGYFSLAVLVANGIIIISGPVSTAIMPRLASLYAENKLNEAVTVYCNATQIISIIVGSAAISIAFFPELVLYAWSGDKILTQHTAPILQLYVIGNMMLVISAFPYYLQYAQGNLRYHLIGNIVMAVLLIPTVIAIAIKYGSLGAGYTWLIVNILFLFIWVGYVHNKISPGLHYHWLINNVIKITILPFIFSTITYLILSGITESRINAIVTCVFICCINFILSILSSGKARDLIKNTLSAN